MATRRPSATSSRWSVAASTGWRNGSLRDLDLADDATQRALVAIWRDLPQLRDPSTFEAWAYRVLVRTCYAEGKRERAANPNLRVIDLAPAIEADASGVVIARDELERGFRRLSIDQRAVIVLHYYVDLPLDRVRRDPRRSRPARSGRVSTSRCAACERRSTPMPGSPGGR